MKPHAALTLVALVMALVVVSAEVRAAGPASACLCGYISIDAASHWLSVVMLLARTVEVWAAASTSGILQCSSGL